MEAIEFLRKKIDEVISQIAEYRVKENNEGLEAWEEVALDQCKTELEMYTSALSSLKVLEKLLKPKTAVA
ncbi:MAG: hypothetical protein NXH86_04220 [Flavobacteriaceae bacterium]|nr:hypothetical protein [Flavobacteriaceae bacterium]